MRQKKITIERIGILFGIIFLIFLLMININITRTEAGSKDQLDLISIINFKYAFSQSQPDTLYEMEMYTTNLNCFACWSDHFGIYEVICPATTYHTYCFESEIGSDCTEGVELFCEDYSNDCIATGRYCY